MLCGGKRVRKRKRKGDVPEPDKGGEIKERIHASCAGENLLFKSRNTKPDTGEK